jgi:hypothetical protein
MTVTNRIDRHTGRGEVKISLQYEARVLRKWVGPGTNLYFEYAKHGDYRRADLPGSDIGEMVHRCNFDGANLMDARFLSPPDFGDSRYSWRAQIEDTSFRAATCRNASFKGVTFSGYVSFEGADVTGADFEGAWVATVTYAGDYQRQGEAATLDFTDSNITGEQIDQFVDGYLRTGRGYTPGESRILYRRYTLSDASTKLGVPEDELAVSIWVGDVEVRDNHTLQRVTGEFDATRHHIPQWALQYLKDSQR